MVWPDAICIGLNSEDAMPRICLHPIAEGLWDYCHEVRFRGIPLPHRMTVIRLTDGNLLLHSPTRCDEPALEALSIVGTAVTEIVAPNRYHDLFLEEWLDAAPQARLWIPPGTGRLFPQPRGRVRELAQDPLPGDILCLPIAGLPKLDEIAIYHSPSKTLILADLLFNIPKESPFLTRCAARWGGFYRKLAMSRDLRMRNPRNLKVFERSLRQILELPFEKIVVGHGENVLSDAKTEFRNAFRWLLNTGH